MSRSAGPNAQINIRVPPDVEEVLETAAYLKGYRSLQSLLGPVVRDFAADLAKRPSVQAAIRARRQSDLDK
jgi:uncharacterized protein (DUF1778 family)